MTFQFSDLTSCRKLFLEKPIICQLIHKFQNFHEARKFLTLTLKSPHSSGLDESQHPISTTPTLKLSSFIRIDNKRFLLVHFSLSKFCMQSYCSRAYSVPRQSQRFKNFHLERWSDITFNDFKLHEGQTLCGSSIFLRWRYVSSVIIGHQTYSLRCS
jgi:hypothetical protein